MKTASLIVVIGLMFTGSALAQQPVDKDVAQPDREVAAAELPAERPLDDHHCLRYTGSLITASRNLRDEMRPPKTRGKLRCAPVTGRSWSREDLERTGALNTLDALRMLDPAVF